MEWWHGFWDELGADILRATYQHLFLTFFAVIIATIIAVPVGVMLARSRKQAFAGSVLGAAGVIQTIPAIALIAVIMLLFVLLGLTGIGQPPALTALVLYALLPVMRNTFTGIRQVDPAVIEVARGMGMTPQQVLFRIQLPLALPFIMAGLRIATVWTIGAAALCSLIGAGGLGDLIIRGLRSVQYESVVAGTVPAAAMAVLFDILFGRIERWFTPAGMQQPGGQDR
ncbi:MAG: ABC transporter permease [Planctomycetota bacterium]